ncbi:Nn.00g019110.m01.CDS01 [Neocucurbitaria sp. VM-36]
MSEPSMAVPSSTGETSTSGSATEYPQCNKYDNFYTPQNKDFYSSIGYLGFKPEDRKIRLLRIQPLKPGDNKRSPIEAELVDGQPLHAVQGKFTTISYCAGDPKKTETIYINGRTFNAFSNLGHALRLVRDFWKEKFGTRELLLWADQVCINQSNPNERSHQVSFMGDIYGSSMQVLVCLSVEGDRSGGIRWLSQFSSEFQKYEKSQPDDEWTSDSDGYVEHGASFFLKHFDERSFHFGWDIFLATVLKSSWWRRAWIRQEFLRSPDAYFLAGNESIHWKAAAEAIEIYYDASYEIHLNMDWRNCESNCPLSSLASSDACQICQRGNIYEEVAKAGRCASRLLSTKLANLSLPSSSDLLDCLKEMHACKASDPKDLIYACFGISTHTYNLYPDYASGLSFPDLLIQVARNVISHSQSLSMILRYACLTRRDLNYDLPSWVPDWRIILATHEGHFHALPSRSTKSFAFHPDGLGQPGRILQVRGVLVKDMDSKSPYLYERFAGRIGSKDYNESYMLHGAGNLFKLRQQAGFFRVVGEILGPDGVYSEVESFLDDFERMVESNDPAITVINIC